MRSPIYGLALREIQCKVVFSSWFAKEAMLLMMNSLQLTPPRGSRETQMTNWKAVAREIRHVLAEAGRSFQRTIQMDSSIMLLSIWMYEVVKSQISQLSCGISLRHAPFWS